MYRILIVEDDTGIANGIEKGLQSWGFETKCVFDFKNVLIAKVQALLRRTYDFSSAVTVLEHRGAMLNVSDGTMTYNGEKYR